MGAAGDAAVADDLHPVADRVDDVGQRVEGRQAAVELAPTMVRHHDRGGADIGGALRILDRDDPFQAERSEEHTSDLQSLMRISYAVFCLKNKTQQATTNGTQH